MRLFAACLYSLITGCTPVWCLATHRDYQGSPELATNQCGMHRHWNYFPISVRVCIDSHMAQDVEEATHIWNEEVRGELLIFERVAEPCAANHEFGAITVGADELGLLPNGNILLGSTNVLVTNSNGMIESAVIMMDEDNDPPTALAVALHELGHALGLDHDPSNPMSIMYPLTWAPGTQTLTESDVQAVREQMPQFLLRGDGS